MFRTVYGLKKERTPAGTGIVEFLEKNKIVAMHEYADQPKNKFLVTKFKHRNNPTLYFCLPDGTQPVEPAIDVVPPAEVLKKLEKLVEAYKVWKEKQK